jgi:hypothetical protein
MVAPAFDPRKLEVLGAALRDARLRCSPRLTLVGIGSDEAAPRYWSHSHLSKIERGLEAPGEDLVRWYEVRTGKPDGYLVHLLYDATGGASSPAFLTSQRGARQWAIDRHEIHCDLRGPRAVIHETRDLVAISDGVTSHTVVVDTRDFETSGRDFAIKVVEGGTIATTPEWISDTLVTVEVSLHRSFAMGEWHRIRLCHHSPALERIPRWMTVVSRYGETRDAIVNVTFNPHDVRPAWRISDTLSGEVFAAFARDSTAPVERVIGGGTRLLADAEGTVSARFSSLLAGLYYGIGWR